MTTPHIPLGRALRAIRDRLGLPREAMAGRLDVSATVLAEMEDGVLPVPPDVAGRFHAAFAIDLHTAAWVLYGDVASLPEAVRPSATALADSWRARLAAKLGEGPAEGGR